MLFQRAFAKINLGLRVLRRREDGFHDIETVFHRVDIHDDLGAELSPALSLNCDDPELPAVGNLVLVAAEKLRERFDVRSGAAMTLKKRIPYGAGLGGGSADAAAALQLLCRLWRLDPSPGVLAEIALGIGADVPYFLGEGSAHATSLGEKLSYFPLVLPHTVLVVAPRICLSTRTAYQSVVPRGYTGADDLRTLLIRHLDRPDLLRNLLLNDFEGTVLRSHPAVGEIKSRLYECGADFCLLSGSGSALFAIFQREETAVETAGRLGAEHRIFLTRPGFTPDLRITERGIAGIAGID